MGKKNKKRDAEAVTPDTDAIDAEIKARLAAKRVERVEEVKADLVNKAGETLAEKLDAAVFAVPSEAPKDDYDTNRLGQYLVKRPSDGKLVGYTRTTTYIDNLDDKRTLEKWKLRVMLEGIVADEDRAAEKSTRPDDLFATSRVRDLVHNRDVAIKRARKADKKGKLEPGELATLSDAAWRSFKQAMDALAEELLQLGGVHEKAAKGTSLHALCETYDRVRYVSHWSHDFALEEVSDVHPDASPADLADVEAYAAAIERAGITIIPELIEKPIVVDELGVAGRADRFVMYKRPDWARARKVVLDVKSGRIDFGAGKIAQQLAMYALGEGYDLDTHERTKIGASKEIGLVLHLPAGSGKATIHEVDLKRGAEGIALSGKVRAWRRESRTAIDVKRDVSERDV